MSKRISKKIFAISRHFKIIYIISVVCMLIIAFQLFYFGTDLGKINNLIQQKSDEPLTELYFNNYTSLQKKINLNQDYFFEFSVHNLEFKDMFYPYLVYLNKNGDREIIDSGSFFLEQGKTKTITEKFKVNNREEKNIQVIVYLSGKKDQISYWVSSENSF